MLREVVSQVEKQTRGVSEAQMGMFHGACVGFMTPDMTVIRMN